jgi:hypothetical protein
VVASIEQAAAARRGARPPEGPADPEARAADQLLAAMRTVKAARFNAAERLERKHTLSLFAMSMVSLYFVGLSVWQAIYAAGLSESANRLITLVSIMSSNFTLVLALIESMKDYRTTPALHRGRAQLPLQPRPRRLPDGPGRARRGRALGGAGVGVAALRRRRLCPARHVPDRAAAGAAAWAIAPPPQNRPFARRVRQCFT